jgi:hypothetical protein
VLILLSWHVLKPCCSFLCYLNPVERLITFTHVMEGASPINIGDNDIQYVLVNNSFMSALWTWVFDVRWTINTCRCRRWPGRGWWVHVPSSTVGAAWSDSELKMNDPQLWRSLCFHNFTQCFTPARFLVTFYRPTIYLGDNRLIPTHHPCVMLYS